MQGFGLPAWDTDSRVQVLGWAAAAGLCLVDLCAEQPVNEFMSMHNPPSSCSTAELHLVELRVGEPLQVWFQVAH